MYASPPMTTLARTYPRCSTTPGATWPRLAVKCWPAALWTVTLFRSTSRTSSSSRLTPGSGAASMLRTRAATSYVSPRSASSAWSTGRKSRCRSTPRGGMVRSTVETSCRPDGMGTETGDLVRYGRGAGRKIGLLQGGHGGEQGGDVVGGVRRGQRRDHRVHVGAHIEVSGHYDEIGGPLMDRGRIHRVGTERRVGLVAAGAGHDEGGGEEGTAGSHRVLRAEVVLLVAGVSLGPRGQAGVKCPPWLSGRRRSEAPACPA